jgi:hypothetical protein
MSTKEEREHIELLQGTLDLLILRMLLLGPRHGHAIAKADKSRLLQTARPCAAMILFSNRATTFLRRLLERAVHDCLIRSRCFSR